MSSQCNSKVTFPKTPILFISMIQRKDIAQDREALKQSNNSAKKNDRRDLIPSLHTRVMEC